MKRFSWYTIPVKLSDLYTVYQYAVDRFIPLEVDRHGFGSYIHVKAGTFVTRHDGGWQRCKPNMKGGHRHNHVKNVLERKLNRSKESRTRCHNYLNKGFVYTLVRCNNHVFFRKIKNLTSNQKEHNNG